MADITYPSTLPDFRRGKQRRQAQNYTINNPLYGAPYSEKTTDDLPVTWDVEITCKDAAQAQEFQAFLKSVKGGRAFYKNIQTEFGHILHEVAFDVEPNEPTQHSDGVWTYRGSIYAQALLESNA